jgi:hypothetical protein
MIARCAIPNLGARWWIAALLILAPPIAAQQITRLERSRGFTMLDLVRDDIRKNYFDSTYGGIDLEAVFDSARARIERADRVEQVLGEIAQATLELNDSHTAFIPPGWSIARNTGGTCGSSGTRAEF